MYSVLLRRRRWRRHIDVVDSVLMLANTIEVESVCHDYICGAREAWWMSLLAVRYGLARHRRSLRSPTGLSNVNE